MAEGEDGAVEPEVAEAPASGVAEGDAAATATPEDQLPPPPRPDMEASISRAVNSFLFLLVLVITLGLLFLTMDFVIHYGEPKEQHLADFIIKLAEFSDGKIYFLMSFAFLVFTLYFKSHFSELSWNILAWAALFAVVVGLAAIVFAMLIEPDFGQYNGVSTILDVGSNYESTRYCGEAIETCSDATIKATLFDKFQTFIGSMTFTAFAIFLSMIRREVAHDAIRKFFGG